MRWHRRFRPGAGSESDDEAAHAWTRAAEILIAEAAFILTLTHSPYAEDGRMRGHSHLWGSFDTRLQGEGNKENRTAVLKVNRHKDHDSRGEWAFQLDIQDIPEHPGETSLVPRLDGAPEARVGRRKLPPSAANALASLSYALDELGEIPPASNHIPRNVRCVTLQQWGDISEKRARVTFLGDKKSSERAGLLPRQGCAARAATHWNLRDLCLESLTGNG
jgi:hypothetical protein